MFKMPNPVQTKQKYSCDRFYRSTNSSSSEKKIINGKKVTPKKTTKKNPKNAKSSSAGTLSSYMKGPVKPKKTTKSDLCFKHNNIPKVNVIDYCKKCGDHIDTTTAAATSKDKVTVKSSADSNILQVTSNSSSKSDSNSSHSRSVERIVISSKSITSDDIPSASKTKDTVTEAKAKPILIKSDGDENLFVNGQPVQQYYKNENFRRSSVSAQQIHKYLKRISFLDPIKELPESIIGEDSDLDSIFRVYSDSDSCCSECLDESEYDSLKKLRDFRDDNYFETHSVQSRVRSKGSVTNLGEHKCNYRFYLNDRLFPVPFNTDHKNTIRCTECHLPLDENKTASKDINGTIQAKVRIGSGDDAQDMVLMLPAKEPLIIKQKRKEKEDDEVVYFGVIKLDSYGNSVFNQTLPSDSLALKYQKGYKEFKAPAKGYEYKKSEDFEVIVI